MCIRRLTIKFSAGFVIGMFFTMFSFSLITVFNVNFDVTVWTNIVIAIATCIATALHVDNQIKLRKTRVWDINKDVLLNLSSTLAKVIKDLEKATDYHFDQMQNIAHETGATYSYPKDLYENFTAQTFEVLNVYKPLMSKDLISSLEKLETVSERVDEGVNKGELSVFEAYDRMLHEHEKLQNKLNAFIKQVAGVQYT
ncbi:hypothetical protein VCSRO186_3497 [Vibrio cholerae]|nr:hypothetical protein [Vibrio cholerae]GHZ35617.1 hypothetical protein VCSRO79_3464 [Vibrio cholerae]GIA89341.1 hypothetical protein VCSRO134_3341 [Vibrio cholerae]GIB35406.1 hypothetical protein VCSRO91_3690 [Vibrio cholerae]GIB39274.1 hypothetical protein VCSRO186_3497 [Vibrio cholerae]